MEEILATVYLNKLPHFSDKDIKAYRSKATGPKLHGSLVAQLEVES